MSHAVNPLALFPHLHSPYFVFIFADAKRETNSFIPSSSFLPPSMKQGHLCLKMPWLCCLPAPPPRSSYTPRKRGRNQCRAGDSGTRPQERLPTFGSTEGPLPVRAEKACSLSPPSLAPEERRTELCMSDHPQPGCIAYFYNQIVCVDIIIDNLNVLYTSYIKYKRLLHLKSSF